MFKLHPPSGHRAAAAAVLLFAFALQSFDLHAELVFRSLALVNGQQHWSSVKKYSNPTDIAYPTGGTEEVHVVLEGAITQADVDSAGVMAALIKNGRQKLAGNSVWLASNGGDIDAAMDFGRLLRELGVFTVIGKDDQCMSACVFAFMGGERRTTAGRIGIHRPFFPYTQNLPDRQQRFRFLQRTLKEYVEELDFPSSLYEAMMLVPPESVKILSVAELKRFYLEGISPSSEDLADAAEARRLDLSMVEYLRHKAKAAGGGG